MLNQNMNVVIYARVSTEMQEEKDSLNNQINRCETYCEMKGYNIVKIYKDVESGSKDDRPDFQKMLFDMNKGLFNAIVVTELSRISRKMSTLIKFLENFQACGVNFVSITQDIDTSSLMGRTFFQLIGVLSEFERGQTRERVAHTMKNIAKRGKFTGGVTPFGYKLIDKKLIVIEEEAEVVRNAYKMYISGLNRAQISKRLNIPKTTLNRMLSTPFYTGKTVYQQRKVNQFTGKLERQPREKWIISEGEHEAIIDEKTYNTAQEIFNNTYAPRIKFEDNPNFLLSGLIKCYHGHKMFGYINSRGHRYYMCYRNSAKYNDNGRCTQYNVSADQLENEVIEYILSLKDLKFKTAALNGVNCQDNDIPYKLRSLEKRKENISSKRSKLISLMLDDKIDDEIFETKNEELSKELKEIERKIKNLNLKANSTTAKLTTQEIFYKILESFSVDKPSLDIKQLLSILIHEIKFINDFEYEIIFNL